MTESHIIDVDGALAHLDRPSVDRWDALLNGEDAADVTEYIRLSLAALRVAYPNAQWIGPTDIDATMNRAPVVLVARDGVLCDVGEEDEDGDFDWEVFNRRETFRSDDVIYGKVIGDTFESAYFDPQGFPYRVFDFEAEGGSERRTFHGVRHGQEGTVSAVVSAAHPS